MPSTKGRLATPASSVLASPCAVVATEAVSEPLASLRLGTAGMMRSTPPIAPAP